MDIRDDFKKGLYYMGRALLGFMATREIFQSVRDKYEEYADDHDLEPDYDYDRYKRKRNAWMKILIPAAGMYLVWRMVKSGAKKKKKKREEEDED